MTEPADRGPTLLRIAHWGLEEGVNGASPGEEWNRVARLPWLDEHGASFVTLEKAGTLRGCIGTLYAWRPLAEDVRANARAAALEDPRFPSVTPDELPGLEVEVSVLGKPEPLEVASREALELTLRPGEDGLILEYRGHRATFLPRVWEGLPDPGAFVSRLLEKSGLEADLWSDEMRWSRYAVRSHGYPTL